MNNEKQDHSLLDWESVLLVAVAGDPPLSSALDWTDNGPVFPSHSKTFPNPPIGGNFREEAPRVSPPDLETTLRNGNNGLDQQRSESLVNNETEKGKQEETEEYYRMQKRAKSIEGHNLSEKNRRKRIRDKLQTLQSMIPNSNKDTASMLEDAVRYLTSLKLQVETMIISYGYGGVQNLVQFEGGGGGGSQGGGRPILPRGCIPPPNDMSTYCYPHPMMSGYVPTFPPVIPMFPSLFDPRHAQFSWPTAPDAATDYSDAPNMGDCSHSAPLESPRHCVRR